MESAGKRLLTPLTVCVTNKFKIKILKYFSSILMIFTFRKLYKWLGLFWISPMLTCLAWNWQTLKENSEMLFSAKISLCVVSWESKKNSWGGLYQWGSGAVDTRSLMVWGWRLTETSLRAHPPPGSTSCVCSSFAPCYVCDQRMNSELWNNWNFGAAPLSLFVILCLPLFFFPLDCPPPSSANSPQLWAPPLLKRHISWCHY